MKEMDRDLLTVGMISEAGVRQVHKQLSRQILSKPKRQKEKKKYTLYN